MEIKPADKEIIDHKDLRYRRKISNKGIKDMNKKAYEHAVGMVISKLATTREAGGGISMDDNENKGTIPAGFILNTYLNARKSHRDGLYTTADGRPSAAYDIKNKIENRIDNNPVLLALTNKRRRDALNNAIDNSVPTAVNSIINPVAFAAGRVKQVPYEVYAKVVKALANDIATGRNDGNRDLYVAGITTNYDKNGNPKTDYDVHIRDAKDSKYVHGDGHSISWDPGNPDTLSYNG